MNCLPLAVGGQDQASNYQNPHGHLQHKPDLKAGVYQDRHLKLIYADFARVSVIQIAGNPDFYSLFPDLDNSTCKTARQELPSRAIKKLLNESSCFEI